MDIILICHLPTKDDWEGLLPGKKDRKIVSPAEEDKMVIQQNKMILKKLPRPDLVLTGTSKRTKETADLYGYKDPQEEPLLDELDFGPFSREEKKDFLEEVGVQWFTNPKRTELGPAVEELEKRILDFLEKYEAHDCLLIFGHPFWIQALLSYVRLGHIIGMNIQSVKHNELVHLQIEQDIENEEKMEEERT